MTDAEDKHLSRLTRSAAKKLLPTSRRSSRLSKIETTPKVKSKIVNKNIEKSNKKKTYYVKKSSRKDIKSQVNTSKDVKKTPKLLKRKSTVVDSEKRVNIIDILKTPTDRRSRAASRTTPRSGSPEKVTKDKVKLPTKKLVDDTEYRTLNSTPMKEDLNQDGATVSNNNTSTTIADEELTSTTKSKTKIVTIEEISSQDLTSKKELKERGNTPRKFKSKLPSRKSSRNSSPVKSEGNKEDAERNDAFVNEYVPTVPLAEETIISYPMNDENNFEYFEHEDPLPEEKITKRLEGYLNKFFCIDEDDITPEAREAQFEKELAIDIRIAKMKQIGLCSGLTITSASRPPITGFHIPPTTQLSNQSKLVTGGTQGQEVSDENSLRNNKNITLSNALWNYGTTSGSFAYPVFDNHRAHLLKEMELVYDGYTFCYRERNRILKIICRGVLRHFQMEKTKEQREKSELIKERNKKWRIITRELNRRFDLVRRIVEIVRRGHADLETHKKGQKNLQNMLKRSEGIMKERIQSSGASITDGSSLATESLKLRNDAYTDDGNTTDPRDADISEGEPSENDDEINQLEKEMEMDIADIIGEDYYNFKEPSYDDDDDDHENGEDSGDDAEEENEEEDKESHAEREEVNEPVIKKDEDVIPRKRFRSRNRKSYIDTPNKTTKIFESDTPNDKKEEFIANDSSDNENDVLEAEMNSDTDGEEELRALEDDIDIEDLKKQLSNFQEEWSEEESEERTDDIVENHDIESEDNSGVVPDDISSDMIEPEHDIKHSSQQDKPKEVEKLTNIVQVEEGQQITTNVPFLVRGKLREYQHIGLDWLAKLYDAGLNGILADEMGLGKTIQTISLLAWLAVERQNWGPHLIVVPASVLLNWEMEFKKWLPGFKVISIYGSAEERQRRRTGWNKENAVHVCITSYQIILKDQSIFKRKRWGYLILDEAHNIKNFRSQRWRTLLTLQTTNRLLLTGTPLQNDLMELWSLLYFLMPATVGGKMGLETGFASHDDFRAWFSGSVEKMMGDGNIVPSIGGNEQMDQETKNNVNRLHTLLRPYILRRLKRDVEKQMPAKYEHIVLCKLSKRQRFLYDDFMSRARTRESLATGNYLAVANVLMQLRKVCNHPDLFEERDIVTGFCLPSGGIPLQMLNQNKWAYTVLWRMLDSINDSKASNLTRVIDYRNEGQISFSTYEGFLRTSSIKTINELINFVGKALESRKVSPNVEKYRNLREWHLHERNQKLLERKDKLESLKLRENILSIHNYKRPLYSSGLLTAVNAIDSNSILSLQFTRNNPRNFLSYSSRLSDCILSMKDRKKSVDYLDGFTFFTPKVRLCQFSSGKNPWWYELSPDISKYTLENIDETNRKVVKETNNIIYPRLALQQLQFPEKRLLQYDCGKLQQLDILLRNLYSGGHKALIFTQMTKMLDVLESFLNIHGYRYLRLDGTTKIEQRQIMMEQFNTDPRIFVFILSTRSGGVGMNLTGADSVIFYDSDWNPAMDAQAQDRAHRIGQTREVHIYRLVSQGTVEENILRKANQKRRLEQLAITSGKFRHIDYNPGGKEEEDNTPTSAENLQASLGGQSLGWRDWLDDGSKLGGYTVGNDATDDKAWKAAITQVEDAVDVEAGKKVQKEVEQDNIEEVTGNPNISSAVSEAGTLTTTGRYKPINEVDTDEILNQSSRFNYEYFLQLHLEENKQKIEPGGLISPQGSLDEYLFRQVISEYELSDIIDWKVFAHELYAVGRLDEALSQ